MSFVKRESLGNLQSTNWYKYALERTGVPMPNCFSYACARISEIVGKNQPLDTVKVRGGGDLWEGHAPEFTKQKYARRGALMIWKGGVGNYGHVAVCEDIIDVNTIEWSESNYGANMFGIGRRNPNGYAGLTFMGYLYHKDLPADEPAPKPDTGEVLNAIPSDFRNEKAKFTLTVDSIKIRRAPSLNGADTGLTYSKGESVFYDGYVKRDGYVWISWISMSDHTRRWMACRVIATDEPWGTFS